MSPNVRRPAAPVADAPAARPLLAALAALLLLLPACASAAPEETSVRPGANERFLDPGLDVDAFVALFEGESREIAVERDAIVARLDLRSGMEIADVGAGTGLFLEPFARAVGPTGAVYAVDISPGFVEHLAERARAEDLPQVEAVLCPEDSVGLPPDSIDLAFVCDTWHHFEFPRSTLASLAEALRPGGRLVVVDFERIPGESREWVLDHVRVGKAGTVAEITAAGFRYAGEHAVDGLAENYMIEFRAP